MAISDKNDRRKKSYKEIMFALIKWPPEKYSLSKTGSESALISNREWEHLQKIFENSILVSAVDILKKRGNNPTKATALFGDATYKVSELQNRMNEILRRENTGLFLKRLGVTKRKEQWGERKFALVNHSFTDISP